jgi:GGDEF domain-containing protein
VARALSERVKANSPGSVCIGIGMLRPGQMDDALERADQAMYLAKRAGGGRIYLR